MLRVSGEWGDRDRMVTIGGEAMRGEEGGQGHDGDDRMIGYEEKREDRDTMVTIG